MCRKLMLVTGIAVTLHIKLGSHFKQTNPHKCVIWPYLQIVIGAYVCCGLMIIKYI